MINLLARAFVLCLLVTALAQVSSAQTQGRLTPSVYCVDHIPETNKLKIYWNYTSTYATTVVVPLGPGNFFSPDPAFRNQPTTFEPGYHEKAFSTELDLKVDDALAWFLDDNHASARNSPNLYCGAPLVWKGEWSGNGPYYRGEIVSYQGSSWRALKNIPAPVIPAPPNAPPAEGEFWTAFLQKGEKGDKGDPGTAGQSVTGTAEPAGSNCAYGGVKYTDAAGIRFVCNGAPGPQGIQGPPGNSNTFLSSQVYTFPRGGTLTVIDARVTANSVIYLQYVGGGLLPPVAINVVAGRFTAVGIPGKQFRYVVFN